MSFETRNLTRFTRLKSPKPMFRLDISGNRAKTMTLACVPVATDQHVYCSLFLYISHAALFSTSKSNSETIYKFRHIYSL